VWEGPRRDSKIAAGNNRSRL